MLSPNGPRDSYNAVVRDPTLTSTSAITRSRTIDDSTTGDVTCTSPAPRARSAARPSARAGGRREVVGAVLHHSDGHRLLERDRGRDLRGLALRQRRRGDGDHQGEDRGGPRHHVRARPIGGDIIAPATTGKLWSRSSRTRSRPSYPDHTFRVVVTSPAGDTSARDQRGRRARHAVGTLFTWRLDP
jgi:hypothetical protein